MAVSKPLPGVPIDPGNTWARGLVLALPFTEGGGQYVQNYAPQCTQISGVGSGLLPAGSNSGSAVNVAAARSSFASFSGNFTNGNTGKLSVFVRLKLVAASTVVNTILSDKQTTGTQIRGCGIYLTVGVGTTGSIFFTTNGTSAAGGYTVNSMNSRVGQWFDVWCEYDGASGWSIQVDGVNDFIAFASGARGAGTLGCDIGRYVTDGTPAGYATNINFDCMFRWEGRNFTNAEKRAFRANPWALWPDDQIVFAPASTYPAWVLSSGGILYKQAATSGDKKIYLSSGGLVAKTSASAGDKLLTLSSGIPLAT